LIALAGLIVRNSILLVDFVNEQCVAEWISRSGHQAEPPAHADRAGPGWRP